MKSNSRKIKEYFSCSSFILGMAKIFDFCNVISIMPRKRHFSNKNKCNLHYSSEIDYQALKSDWEAVGKDIQRAIYGDTQDDL